MTRKVRIIGVVAALLALQLGAVLVYRAVERSRREAANPATTSGEAGFAHERLSGGERAVTIEAARPDGSAAPLTWPSARVRLVHFWATWCEPCKRELPGLLAFARGLADRSPGFELIAVAIDDDWRDIAAFFAEVGGGAIPAEVRLAPDASAAKRFGVSTLPDSYLVAPDGALRERYHGARDWSSPAARAHLLEAIQAR